MSKAALARTIFCDYVSLVLIKDFFRTLNQDINIFFGIFFE